MKVEDNDNLKPSTDVTKIDSLISEISDLINKMNEIQEKSFSPEIIQESQEQLKFFKAFKETIQPLLDDSLTELTRQRQKRLLVTSALCLIIAPGVVILKSLEIEGVQIEVPSIWAITLAITVATLYYLIIFVCSYCRDMNIRTLMLDVPLREAKLLFEQHNWQFAENFQPCQIELYKSLSKLSDDLKSFIVSKDSGQFSGDVRFQLSEITKPFFEKSNNLTSELKNKNAINNEYINALKKISLIDRLSLSVELWLPIGIAVLSIFIGIKQITGF